MDDHIHLALTIKPGPAPIAHTVIELEHHLITLLEADGAFKVVGGILTESVMTHEDYEDAQEESIQAQFDGVMPEDDNYDEF